jgi:Domain of unknown function (DUF6458)
MGLVVSLLLAAAGLILALAVHPASSGSVDVNTVGWILFVVGLVGLILDLLLWSSMGPGYLRRTQVVDEPYAPRARAYPARPRRTVVEEEDVPPPAGY